MQLLTQIILLFVFIHGIAMLLLAMRIFKSVSRTKKSKKNIKIENDARIRALASIN